MALPTPSDSSTCLVTGASSGIGADIARELVRRGQHVTVVARRSHQLGALVAELGPDRATAITADLSDPAERTRLLGEITRRIDVLVNNAGIGTSGPVTEVDPEAEVAMVRVNVEALIDLTARVLPGLVERGSGGLLNVASTAAFQPLPGQAGYAATKAFVLSYTEALRSEVAGSGVAVTAVCPGPVDTEFGEKAGFDGQQLASVPKVVWTDSRKVAREAVDGLEHNRGVVVPGLLNRLGSVSGRLMPRTLLLPLLKRAHPSLRD